jgi:DNA modification methylase
MFSFAGDTVLDPFGGTGTTGIAALEMGRNSISIEIEPIYVDQIEARFSRLGSVVAQVDISRPVVGCEMPNSAAAI